MPVGVNINLSVKKTVERAIALSGERTLRPSDSNPACCHWRLANDYGY
jgi:hypothetical protein